MIWFLDLTGSYIQISQSHLEILLSEFLEKSSGSSKSGSTVKISSRVSNGMYNIEIMDQGTGMSFYQIKNTSKELLRPYNRAFYNRSEADAGFVLSKLITKLYSGTYKVDIIFGKYTKITVSLPIYNN